MKVNVLERLPEPLIELSNNSATYAKIGLPEYGPFAASKDSHGNRITIGIIGTKELIDKTISWINNCNNPIESKPYISKDSINKDLFPDFPGFDIAFQAKLVVPDSYTQIISLSEIAKLGDGVNTAQYSEQLLTLFEEKMNLILETNEIKPDVILCVLTNKMFETCHIVGDYHKKIKKGFDPNQLNLFQDIDAFKDDNFKFGKDDDIFYRDFRSALKKIAMKPQISIPIQIVKEPTLDMYSETTQNAATKAWNFSTGLYYKSGRQPWILKDIDSDTCYLGISFFHKKNAYSDDIYTSMANLFANDFDDIVMKGKKVGYNKNIGGPYLNYHQAKNLLEESLSVFETIKKSRPKRVVIHKTTQFNENETKGMEEVLQKANILYDLVTIKKSTLRLLRYGKMPIPRGSYFVLDNTAFLYTKGFIPELKTYPGVHIPAPFEIIKTVGDSSYKQICTEILALTKLNWNTADFCSGLPITIGFAQNVGRVLREFNDDDSFEPQKSYRFYM